VVFGDPQAPANNFAGGSPESGNQSDSVAEKSPESDVLKRAIEQLKPPTVISLEDALKAKKGG
jgi:hypothetical protein